jgi:hypothetical protein
LKPAEDVLRELVQGSYVAVNSNSTLVGSVDAAAAKDDDRRKEKEDGAALRRKSQLEPIPKAEWNPFHLTPWDVLHTIGKGIALSRQGAGRGLAEHWGSLKYTQALEAISGAYMRLSAEGKKPRSTIRPFSPKSSESASLSPWPSRS